MIKLLKAVKIIITILTVIVGLGAIIFVMASTESRDVYLLLCGLFLFIIMIMLGLIKLEG